MSRVFLFVLLILPILGCHKKKETQPSELPASFSFNSLRVNGKNTISDYRGANPIPQIKISFTSAIDTSSVSYAFKFEDLNHSKVQLIVNYESHDSTIVVKPFSPLSYISKYIVSVSTALKSKAGGSLISPVTLNLTTAIDSSNKFPVISDDSLLTLVQKQTFGYFWNFAHPVSGMARERNSSGEIVTTGGTGFGIMAIPVAIERKFITRNEG